MSIWILSASVCLFYNTKMHNARTESYHVTYSMGQAADKIIQYCTKSN